MKREEKIMLITLRYIRDSSPKLKELYYFLKNKRINFFRITNEEIKNTFDDLFKKNLISPMENVKVTKR